jgi:hypothetical protein
MIFSSKPSIKESLLSSDFYLRECGNRRVKNFADFKKIVNDHREDGIPLRVYLDGVVGERIFSEWNSTAPTNDVEIYIHQGDKIPPLELMKKMHSLQFRIYSVNWLGDLSICKPIPVGIPTKSFKGIHGRMIQRNIQTDAIQRNRETRYQVYASFDVTTNIIHRKLALENLLANREVFVPNQRLSVEKNLTKILLSKYVISPPGAGADCYRTWEALYLGAIPVVLRKYWPFNHLNLPVKVVESYSAFLDEIENDHTTTHFVSEDFIRRLPEKFL